MNKTNQEKINELRKRFDLLKDKYNGVPYETGSVIETITSNIITPILLIDIQSGIEMWEYIINTYGGKEGIDYDLDNIIRYSDSSIIEDVFRNSETIREYTYRKISTDCYLWSNMFVIDLINHDKLQFASTLIKLILKNENGESFTQQRLCQFLELLLDGSDTQWLISEKGLEFVKIIISLIADETKKVIFETKWITLKDKRDGKLEKTGMSLDLFLSGETQILDEMKDQTDRLSEYESEDELYEEDEDDSLTEINQKIIEQKDDTVDLDSALNELNDLIGLGSVKSDVNSLVNLIKVKKLREQKELKTPEMSLHLVFSGNPGTGKTTVARILGRIYKDLGVLSKGHLIEVDRSGLVAGYVGQTAIKTKNVLQKAKGGILFIDEAYSLANSTENDFGGEAIETILKTMEDNRSDLVVIVAGYDDLMHKFIDSNPGLKSRFNKYINFPDYDENELYSIFEHFANKNDYIISQPVESFLKSYFERMYQNRNNNFGNARDVRNIFEKIVSDQADRIVTINNPTVDDLLTITMDDLDQIPSIALKK